MISLVYVILYPGSAGWESVTLPEGKSSRVTMGERYIIHTVDCNYNAVYCYLKRSVVSWGGERQGAPRDNYLLTPASSHWKPCTNPHGARWRSAQQRDRVTGMVFDIAVVIIQQQLTCYNIVMIHNQVLVLLLHHYDTTTTKTKNNYNHYYMHHTPWCNILYYYDDSWCAMLWCTHDPSANQDNTHRRDIFVDF